MHIFEILQFLSAQSASFIKIIVNFARGTPPHCFSLRLWTLARRVIKKVNVLRRMLLWLRLMFTIRICNHSVNLNVSNLRFVLWLKSRRLNLSLNFPLSLRLQLHAQINLRLSSLCAKHQIFISVRSQGLLIWSSLRLLLRVVLHIPCGNFVFHYCILWIGFPTFR